MTRSRFAVAVTSTALCAALITGCTGQQEQAAPEPSASETTPQTPGDGNFASPEDADRSDVDSTAETAALMLHSWDTALDTTETAAAIRAKPLMSDEWAAAQVEPERNSSQGEWLEPGKVEAYSQPTLMEGAGDAAAHDYGPDRAERRYEVTWTWQGRDGSTIPSNATREVVIYLERHDGTWEVVGHHTSHVPGQSQIEESDTAA